MSKYKGRFDLIRSGLRKYRFYLLAINGQVLLQSDIYMSKQNALDAIASVKKNAALDGRYGRSTTKSDKLCFYLNAANHQIIGVSLMYESEASRDIGIECVKRYAPYAEIVDLT